MKQQKMLGSLIEGRFSSQRDEKFQSFHFKKNRAQAPCFVDATSKEIEYACELASIAFEKYSQTSVKEKSDFLNTIIKEIKTIQKELVLCYCSETAYDEKRAENELSRTLTQLRLFSEAIEDHYFERIHRSLFTNDYSSPVSLRKHYVPLGPIAVFGASNFPLAFSTMGGDTASALAAGCPVVVKAHPYHAQTGTLVAQAVSRAIEKTNMPKGVFSHLIGFNHHVGVQLINNKNIKGVGFTGSQYVGRKLFDIATKRDEPIPFFAEMGSVNPVIVLPEMLQKNADRLAKQLADAILLGTGQFCTCPGLIIGISSEELQIFSKKIASCLNQLPKGKMVHANIKANFNKLKEKFLKNKYTTCVTDQPNSSEDILEVEQTLLYVDGLDFFKDKELHQEVFGPLAMVISCQHFSHLHKVISSLEGQLTASIMATETELMSNISLLKLLQQKVGRLIFNGVPTGVEINPNMHHGGPYPATTDSRFTSVGLDASLRWLRPVSYQNFPDSLLPNVAKHGSK